MVPSVIAQSSFPADICLSFTVENPRKKIPKESSMKSLRSLNELLGVQLGCLDGSLVCYDPAVVPVQNPGTSPDLRDVR